MIQGGINARQKAPAYDGPLAAKEITPDERAGSVNEKWSENLACRHKRIYLNACAANDGSLLKFSRLEALLPIDCRYELSSVQDNIHSYVADLIKDQLTRRQLVDNTTRNLLRLMSSSCGLSEIRSLSSQRLEVWLQNPKVCCGQGLRLLARICNLGVQSVNLA